MIRLTPIKRTAMNDIATTTDDCNRDDMPLDASLVAMTAIITMKVNVISIKKPTPELMSS